MYSPIKNIGDSENNMELEDLCHPSVKECGLNSSDPLDLTENNDSLLCNISDPVDTINRWDNPSVLQPAELEDTSNSIGKECGLSGTDLVSGNINGSTKNMSDLENRNPEDVSNLNAEECGLDTEVPGNIHNTVQSFSHLEDPMDLEDVPGSNAEKCGLNMTRSIDLSLSIHNSMNNVSDHASGMDLQDISNSNAQEYRLNTTHHLEASGNICSPSNNASEMELENISYPNAEGCRPIVNHVEVDDSCPGGDSQFSHTTDSEIDFDSVGSRDFEEECSNSDSNHDISSDALVNASTNRQIGKSKRSKGNFLLSVNELF
jgi:hypothetical protein